MEEDIRDFEVPMDDIFLCQIFEAQKNVSNDGGGFLFSKWLGFSQFRLKIALVAHFSDYVAVSVACEYFIAAQDVGMIEFFKHFDLREQKFFEFLGLEWIELDDFYSYGLV